MSAAVELLTHLVSPQSAGIDNSPDYQVGTRLAKFFEWR